MLSVPPFVVCGVAMLFVLLAFITQATKAIESGKTRDLSLTSYLIYVVGTICYIVYGVLSKQKTMVSGRVGLMLTTFVLLGFILNNCSDAGSCW